MKKRILFFSALTAVSLCFSSLAASVDYSLKNEFNYYIGEIDTTISVNGEFGAGNAFLKTSVAITDDAKNGGDKIKALKQTRLDEDGKLELSFIVRADSGEYSFVVKPEGEASGVVKSIRLTDYTNDGKLLDSIYDEIATAETIKEAFDNKND